MIKRIVRSAVILALIITASVCTIKADGSVMPGELRQCKHIYSYSGKANAYFYGYSGKTLCSTRVIPNSITRYVSVSGTIRAVCHDENCAYALYDGSNKSYGVVRMNMNSGECDYCTISDTQNAVNRSFAVAGNEIFIIFNSRIFPVVKSYNFSGKYLKMYEFTRGAECLFCNGGYAYARDFNGEIFSLSGKGKTKRAELEAYTEFFNAGDGYIFTRDKRIILLNGGYTERPDCDLAVKTPRSGFYLTGSALRYSGGEAEVGSARLLCAVGSTAAVLRNDFLCEIVNINNNTKQISSNTINRKPKISDSTIVGIEAGTTVARLKEMFSDIKKIHNHNGAEVTSGLLKTGYTAQTPEGSYRIALTGDVNSSGTLNSADIDELLSALSGSEKLSGWCLKAADLNGDGSVNTKDLVLVGKKTKEE